jgi:hypothetical protein
MEETNLILDNTIYIGNNINESLLTQSEQLDATFYASHKTSYLAKMSVYILNRMTWSGWFLNLFKWRPTMPLLKFWKKEPESNPIDIQHTDNFYNFDNVEIEMMTKSTQLESITNDMHNILNDQNTKIDHIDNIVNKNTSEINKGIKKECILL